MNDVLKKVHGLAIMNGFFLIATMTLLVVTLLQGQNLLWRLNYIMEQEYEMSVKMQEAGLISDRNVFEIPFDPPAEPVKFRPITDSIGRTK